MRKLNQSLLFLVQKKEIYFQDILIILMNEYQESISWPTRYYPWTIKIA